jgi:hypothetical protein
VGADTIPFSITDAQNRTGTGNIALTLIAPGTGACCTGGSCTQVTRYACLQGAGAFSGLGTTCFIANSSNPFSSISTTGTQAATVSECDDCVQTVPLPFTFNFFGQDYTQLAISSNGNLQFTLPASTAFYNDAIPTAATPNNAIYPLWDDLETDSTYGQGDIYYQTDGVSPNQRFTVEWNNVSQYTAGGTYPRTSETFQCVLYEGSNDIEFRYGTITPSDTSNANQGTGLGPGGDDYTIGIENSTGTVAYWIAGTSLGAGNTSRRLNSNHSVFSCGPVCETADFDCDGDVGTDFDIEAFFRCIAGTCPQAPCNNTADFNGDGDTATDADIEAFFRVLAGGSC